MYCEVQNKYKEVELRKILEFKYRIQKIMSSRILYVYLQIKTNPNEFYFSRMGPSV